MRLSRLMLTFTFVCLSLLLFWNTGDAQSADLVICPSVPPETLRVGDTFTQTIEIRDAVDLTAWRMGLRFNPQSVQYVDVREGHFLKQDRRETFFQSIDYATPITVNQIRLGSASNRPGGITGDGELIEVTFSVLQLPVDLLNLDGVLLSNHKGERISYKVWQEVSTTASPAQLTVRPPEPNTQLAVGDIFTQTIEILFAQDLAAWEMNIAFNPEVLEVVEITKGDFLERGGIKSHFTSTLYSSGYIHGMRQERGNKSIGASPVSGVSGTGKLVSIKFRLKEFSEDLLGLSNVRLSNSAGKSLPYFAIIHPIVAIRQFPPEDVDRNGVVDILDLLKVTESMGQTSLIPLRSDVNNDGIVDLLDLAAVANSPYWGRNVAFKTREPNVPAPDANVASVTAAIQGWIDLAQVEDDGSAIFDRGIANLERLLQATVPERTKLLLNYPNPFNPETWIPYQLATATDVTVSIYSVNGTLVRTLALGHQAAGVYQSKSQAAYWDGRNELGEQVASGVYFYTLTAGGFSATGKMLVRK